MDKSATKATVLQKEVYDGVARVLQRDASQLRYGEVSATLRVHEGKIVQVTHTKKSDVRRNV